MADPKIEIRPEYSAQRRSHPTNIALRNALTYLGSTDGSPKRRLGRVADLGCGKLRHYCLLREAKELYLVDTEFQLTTNHVDSGVSYTVRGYAEAERKKGQHVHVKTSEQFWRCRLNLDLIVCVAVMDVVLPAARREILATALRNLRAGGILVLIAPRNDSTILRRCNEDNAYSDGHVFHNRGTHTFFHNFRDQRRLIELAERAGFRLVKDMSIYRHVSLLFEK